MPAPDVQITVNDLMAAFATENATLTQRAVIAEQKVKAYHDALEEAHEVIEQQQRHMAAQLQAAEHPPLEVVPDAAVDAVSDKPKPRRSRTRTP